MADPCRLINTAADPELLTRDPARIVGREEYRGLRNVLRLAGPAERRLAHRVLLVVGSRDASAVRALRDRQARIERVDGDGFWSELLRQHAGGYVAVALPTNLD